MGLIEMYLVMRIALGTLTLSAAALLWLKIYAIALLVILIIYAISMFIAWLINLARQGSLSWSWFRNPFKRKKAPEPVQQPLTEEEIVNAWNVEQANQPTNSDGN